MPDIVLVEAKNNGQRRLARTGVWKAPADASAALIPPTLMRELEPKFDASKQLVIATRVRPAKRSDALIYTPKGFAGKVWAALAAALISTLGSIGVLLSVQSITPALWVWLGVSVAVALAVFFGAVKDALKP
jgi:hypothetical protein